MEGKLPTWRSKKSAFLMPLTTAKDEHVYFNKIKKEDFCSCVNIDYDGDYAITINFTLITVIKSKIYFQLVTLSKGMNARMSLGNVKRSS